MADSTVAALTAASVLDGTELYYGVQGGADRKVTGNQIKTLVGTPGGAPTGSAGGDLAGTYPNPTLGFASASAAAAAADADTFPTNQGAGTLKQTLAALKAWIKSWVVQSATDMLGYVPSNWYLASFPGVITIAGLSSSVTQQLMVPFVVRQTITINALGVRTTTAGTTNIQLGIYASGTGAALNRPGALLGNTGNIPNNGTAGFYSAALGANVQLTPGIYWVAYQCNDTTCLVKGASASSTAFEIFIGSATGAGANGALAVETISVAIPSVFGTWVTAVGATFTEQNTSRSPLVNFQVFSTP